MGSLLLTAGDKGMRFATPNARIMLHQPSGGFRGTTADIERHGEDILKIKRRMNEIYVKHTGQPLEKVEKTLDRDFYMDAMEAKEFGLIDHVYEKRGGLKRPDSSQACLSPEHSSRAAPDTASAVLHA